MPSTDPDDSIPEKTAKFGETKFNQSIIFNPNLGFSSTLKTLETGLDIAEPYLKADLALPGRRDAAVRRCFELYAKLIDVLDVKMRLMGVIFHDALPIDAKPPVLAQRSWENRWRQYCALGDAPVQMSHNMDEHLRRLGRLLADAEVQPAATLSAKDVLGKLDLSRFSLPRLEKQLQSLGHAARPSSHNAAAVSKFWVDCVNLGEGIIRAELELARSAGLQLFQEDKAGIPVAGTDLNSLLKPVLKGAGSLRGRAFGKVTTSCIRELLQLSGLWDDVGSYG